MLSAYRIISGGALGGADKYPWNTRWAKTGVKEKKQSLLNKNSTCFDEQLLSLAELA